MRRTSAAALLLISTLQIALARPHCGGRAKLCWKHAGYAPLHGEGKILNSETCQPHPEIH